MPETRTFDPDGSDPVQAAIRAALGESIRPNEPGASPAGVKPAPSQPTAVTLATLGSYTFVAAPPPGDADAAG